METMGPNWGSCRPPAISSSSPRTCSATSTVPSPSAASSSQTAATSASTRTASCSVLCDIPDALATTGTPSELAKATASSSECVSASRGLGAPRRSALLSHSVNVTTAPLHPSLSQSVGPSCDGCICRHRSLGTGQKRDPGFGQLDLDPRHIQHERRDGLARAPVRGHDALTELGHVQAAVDHYHAFIDRIVEDCLNRGGKAGRR